MSSAEEHAELIDFVHQSETLQNRISTGENDIAEFMQEHSALAQLYRWLDGCEERHTTNMQDSTASGLLPHLRDAWAWNIDRVGAEFRASLGVPGSCRELGQLIDAQITALLAGVELPQWHDFTKMVVQFMCDRHWMPVAAQSPLWHRSNSVYTFIDVLAYDVVNKCIVLIELKTGFDHAYDTPIADTHREMDVFVDTHHMRHQQQLCWMLNVLAADLPPETALVACILRVSAVEGVRAPDWADAGIAAYFRQTYIDADSAYNKPNTPL
jgi:hypothetical protein